MSVRAIASWAVAPYDYRYAEGSGRTKPLAIESALRAFLRATGVKRGTAWPADYTFVDEDGRWAGTTCGDPRWR